MNKKRVQQQGFTLVELMIAVLILTISLSGLLHAFSTCFILNENSRNISLALNGAQEMIEQIRNDDFDDIYDTYNGGMFNLGSDWFLSDNDHKGVIEVIKNGSDTASITNDDLLQVRVVICWRQQGGRIIGEDINLNGELDTGEDKSSPLNGRIDSPAELITLISNQSD